MSKRIFNGKYHYQIVAWSNGRCYYFHEKRGFSPQERGASLYQNEAMAIWANQKAHQYLGNIPPVMGLPAQPEIKRIEDRDIDEPIVQLSLF